MLTATVSVGFAGCASNLQAVKVYGSAAAKDPDYAAAGKAYHDSAVATAPYLMVPSPVATDLAVPNLAAPNPAAPSPAVPNHAVPSPAAPNPAAPNPAAPSSAAPDPASVDPASADAAARTQAGAVASEPTPQDPAARGRQVRATLQLHAAMTAYFSTLAALAGADAAPFDKQIDHIAKGVGGLSALDGVRKADVDAAADLLHVLVAAVHLPAQVRSVQRLVDDGGPAAMRLLGRLREVLASWDAAVRQDGAMVQDPLQMLALARDAPPLAVLLARDRAATLARDHAAALRSIGAADLALRRIAAGHADIAAHLDDLSGAALAEQLAGVVTDLQTLGVLGLD